MNESSEWTGVTTRGSDSAFNAKVRGETRYECFNCGENHSLKDCPHPRKEQRITENRKKFLSAKRDKAKKPGKKSTSKYSGPTPAERGRRMIDGKMHYYHHSTRRWKVCDRPDEVAPKANVTTATTTTAPSTITPTDDSAQASELLKIANAKKQFKNTLLGLSHNLNDSPGSGLY